MKKEIIIDVISLVLMFVMFFWLILSCAEISAHNMTDHIYSKFNLIIILYNLFS